MEQGVKEAYRILLHGGQGEIIEKKSRFIATIESVEEEAQALTFIEETKKKYWEARHNCSAFVIGDRAQLTRCSDDGEPSGTAGRPMLEVLLGEGIRNIAVVVTRYFGGTLLGTGGLVRAYTQAVKTALENCETAVMRYGVRMLVETDYNGVGKIQYLLGQHGIETEEAEYTDKVRLIFTAGLDTWNQLEKELVEVTAGRVHMEVLEEAYFIDKERTYGVR